MAKRSIPNFSKPAHVDAVRFQATTEFLGELCLRGLQATTEAFDLAAEDSSRKTLAIIGDAAKSFEERNRLLHDENKREAFFKDFGRSQHLAASTVLSYSTLDTVLAEAVRLLSHHVAISAPPQNRGGASIDRNLPHLQKALPHLSPLSARHQEFFQEFAKIRNILIHQGYFIDDSDPKVVKLRRCDDHGDYFELNPGFPVLLRDYGVRGFVTICKDVILNVGDAVYHRLLSS